MPVFRKRNTHGEDRQFVSEKQGLIHQVEKEVVDGKLLRTFTPAKKPDGTRSNKERSTLSRVKQEFRLVFPEEGESFVDKRFREVDSPLVCLFWGCGRGVAAKQFSQEYDDKVSVFGYGRDSYPEWREPGDVTFIHSTKEDLFRYLKKIDPVDLAISFLGLYWLLPTSHDSDREVQQKMDKGIGYIDRLVDHLAPGGKLMTNITIAHNQEVTDALKKVVEGKASLDRDRYQIYITKNEKQG